MRHHLLIDDFECKSIKVPLSQYTEVECVWLDADAGFALFLVVEHEAHAVLEGFFVAERCFGGELVSAHLAEVEVAGQGIHVGVKAEGTGVADSSFGEHFFEEVFPVQFFVRVGFG